MKKLLFSIIVIMLSMVNVCFGQAYENLTVITSTPISDCGYTKTYIDADNLNSVSFFSARALVYDLKQIFDYTYSVLKEHNKENIVTIEYGGESNQSTNSVTGMIVDLKNKGFRLKLADLDYVMEKLMYESGELFLNKSCNYSSFVENGVTYIGFILFNYCIDIDDIDATLDIIDNKIENFKQSLPWEDLSELEKALLVHDYIAMNAHYRPNNDNTYPTAQYHSMYGTFINGVCVCQGYTEAYKYMLNKLGMECVSCVCDDINHVWNVVKVDDKWYHVDITWNDPLYSKYMYNGSVNTHTHDNYINYKGFLNGLDDVISQKNGQLSFDRNDNLLLDENGNPIPFVYEEGDFVYPSGIIDDDDTKNYEFRTGYVFNNIKYYPILTSSGIEKLEPNGFIYKDGNFVNTVSSNGYAFANKYIFEFDSLKSTDIAVSKPVKLSNNNTHFLSRELNSTMPFENLNIFIKDIKNDKIFTIDKITGVPGKNKIADFFFINVPDSNDILTIDNLTSGEFFIWNDNQRPLCYKITK